MEKSKVYFCNLRARPGYNLLQKLEKLIKTAGIETINFKEKFVAVKIHFGEPGNLAYLRPNFAKVLVDLIEAHGGKPFLTDCNTLYVGRRTNGLDHLDSAYENGYNPFCTNCHSIIADGIKGNDEVLVDIKGDYVKQAKIGRALMDADIVVSLNHFKGHEATGFGGALKNIGMGGGSRAGKMEMHNSGKPDVKKSKCTLCKLCVKQCAHGAISFDQKQANINPNKCVGCGRCLGVCAFNAIYTKYDEANDILNKKIAEYTFAVLKDRPHFHINFVIDVSPDCDCHAENDLPIIPDVGMFASFDPVALDIACADMANKQPVIKGSKIDGVHKDDKDRFNNSHPETNWRVCIEHAKKFKVGTDEYELVEIK